MIASIQLFGWTELGLTLILLFFLPFSITAIEIAFVLLLILWLLQRANVRTRWNTLWREPSVRPVLWALGGFLAACAASVVRSDAPAQSINGFVFKWLEYLLYAVIMAEMGTRPGFIRFVTTIVAASTVFVVIEGVTQELFGRGIFRGHLQVVYARMTGPYRNPIDLATYFMTVLPLLIAGGSIERGWRRWAFGGVIGLALMCFGRTMATGPWVSFILAVGILWAYGGQGLRRDVAVVMSVLVAFSAFFLHHTRIAFDILSLSDVGTSDRMFMWQSALRMIGDRPIVGHGLNTFMGNYLRYWVGGEMAPRYAHNCYLQMAAETGIVGLVAFLWLLGSIGLVVSRGVGRSVSQERVYLLGLAASLAAFVFHAGVDTNFYSVRQAACFWIFAGLSIGLSVRVVAASSSLASRPAANAPVC